MPKCMVVRGLKHASERGEMRGVSCRLVISPHPLPYLVASAASVPVSPLVGCRTRDDTINSRLVPSRKVDWRLSYGVDKRILGTISAPSQFRPAVFLVLMVLERVSCSSSLSLPRFRISFFFSSATPTAHGIGYWSPSSLLLVNMACSEVIDNVFGPWAG